MLTVVKCVREIRNLTHSDSEWWNKKVKAVLAVESL